MTKGHFRPWLFAIIVFMHVMALYGLWYVSTHHGFNLKTCVWFLGIYILRQEGVSLGSHRLFTHVAFKCDFATKVVLAFCAGLSAEGPLKSWCADHWQHHKDTEGPWDPHSPGRYSSRWKGFWWSHMVWLFFEVKRPPDVDFDHMFERREPRLNRWDKWIFPVAVLSGFVFPLCFAGVNGLLLAGFVGVVFHWHATWSINSIAHILGSTNRFHKGRKDTSKNNPYLALISWVGEPFHDNHHAKPNSARLGWKWYQFDLGYWTIRLLLEPLGLAWDVILPPADA